VTPRPDWDPGWKKAILSFRLWPIQPKTPAGLPSDPLTSTRRIFIGLVLSSILYVVAFSFIAPADATETWASWVLAVYAIILHAVLVPFGLRMMTIADEEPQLILRYRSRFFIGVGESFAAELVAVLFTFFGAPFVTIVVGCLITLSGSWRIAPLQRVFRLCDERLQAQGKTIRMTDAWRHLLTDPPPDTPPPPS